MRTSHTVMRTSHTSRGTLVFVACLLTALAATAYAVDEPVYDAETGTLTIPSAEAEGQPGRFQNVVLKPASEGGWQVDSLDEGVLLDAQYVETVRTLSTDGIPVQYFVHLSGTFPNGCPEVGRVVQKREGDTFEVYVYYAENAWLRDPSVECTDALKPFELTIPLEMYGLEAGEYAVRANGQQIRTFTLAGDNVMSIPSPPSGEAAHCRAHTWSSADDIRLVTCSGDTANELLPRW